MTEINTPLLRKVLEHITAHPEEWDQETWARRSTVAACGTAYCLAGHAVVMSGYSIDWTNKVTVDTTCGQAVDLLADEVLGLTMLQGNRLYRAKNSLRDLYSAANDLTDGEIEIPATLPDGS